MVNMSVRYRIFITVPKHNSEATRRPSHQPWTINFKEPEFVMKGLRPIEAQEPREGGQCGVRNVVLDPLGIEFG